MKFTPKVPPRRYRVGVRGGIEISDCGSLSLTPDEQVTFLTEDGGEYDVARKEWGFYATPSLNGRLRKFKLRGVLVHNPRTARYFVLLVEEGRESAFEAYLKDEGLMIAAWMDNTDALDALTGRALT